MGRFFYSQLTPDYENFVFHQIYSICGIAFLCRKEALTIGPQYLSKILATLSFIVRRFTQKCRTAKAPAGSGKTTFFIKDHLYRARRGQSNS